MLNVVLPWILALPRTVSGLIFPGEDGGPHPAGWLRKALARGARAAGVIGTLCAPERSKGWIGGLCHPR